MTCHWETLPTSTGSTCTPTGSHTHAHAHRLTHAHMRGHAITANFTRIFLLTLMTILGAKELV